MRTKTVIAAIGLGSNVGDRAAYIASAIRALSRLPDSRLVAIGPVVSSAAVGREGVDPGGEYLNSAALLRTRLSPRRLLAHLLRIERGHGRVRAGVPAWSPRTLDLDLLIYGERPMQLPGLTVPHPRMQERLFVLRPLAAIAPDLVVPPPALPGRSQEEPTTVHALLKALVDRSSVQQSSHGP